jgi:hypothetical protein
MECFEMESPAQAKKLAKGSYEYGNGISRSTKIVRKFLSILATGGPLRTALQGCVS